MRRYPQAASWADIEAKAVYTTQEIHYSFLAAFRSGRAIRSGTTTYIVDIAQIDVFFNDIYESGSAALWMIKEEQAVTSSDLDI